MLNFVYKPLVRTKDDLLTLAPVDHESRWINDINETWVYCTDRGWENLLDHAEADRNGPIGAAEDILNSIVDIIEQTRAFRTMLEEYEEGHNWARLIDEALVEALNRAAPFRWNLVKRDEAEEAFRKAIASFIEGGV